MKYKFILLLSILFHFIINHSIGQVAIGTGSPDSSAILDLNSTSLGLLLPRMTTEQHLAISNPAAGLIIFNTDAADVYCFNGSSWMSLTGKKSIYHCGAALMYEGQYNNIGLAMYGWTSS